MKSAGRYEIREILGEGGMGVVYRGFDPVMNREVTIKTIRDPQDQLVLELFKRECAVLASMSHPNIVEIFDVGEVEEAGAKRPYFVMPLLQGVTLQELIRTSSPRLTVERCVQMISQACRGLQAAHEHKLVHRDLKPSNLFILPDDSVKIIDFGVAHLTDHRSVTGLKGTLLYMAPEQIQRKQPTPLADQFSLAVVAYEMLARRHPFGVSGEEDLAQAILRFTPPPVSDFNPVVSGAISQVIHKALAKEPFFRFSGVREFADSLQKALRGEPIDAFDPARITPRLERARKSFQAGDVDDAAEILSELESQSYLTPEISALHKEIEEIRRVKTVKQLLETARKRFEEEEYVRALQKVQEVLDLDSGNTEAFTLKGAIEGKRSGTQIEEWFRLAHQHMENHAYSHARQALQKVLDIRPKEGRANALLTEVERREQEYVRLRNEKQHAYKSAVDAYQRGEIDSALNKMSRVLDLDRRAAYSTSPEQGAEYQRFYEEVCSKRDHLASQEAEARRYLSEGNFTGALSTCDAVLANYPNNVVFGVLRDDVEQAQRQEIFAYIARIDQEVTAEPDLDRKVGLLEEAQKKYPSEPRFEQSVRQVRARRDKMNSLVGRARMLEEGRQFSDALGQWEILRNIYPQYPGLDIELDRLKKRREQQTRADAKAHWVTQVEQAMAVNNYVKATALTTDALAEFPNDAELVALQAQVQQSQQRTADAIAAAARGKVAYESGSTAEGLALLREAFKSVAQNSAVRNQLVEILLKEAAAHLEQNWRAAEPLIQEALDLEPGHPLARSLSTLLRDKRQDEEVSSALSNARELQAKGNIGDAIRELDKSLATYARDARLVKLRTTLSQNLSAEERQKLRARDLTELTELAKQSKETSDLQKLESILDRSQIFSRYEGDADFREPLSAIEERVRQKQQAETASATLPLIPTPAAPPVRASETPVPPKAPQIASSTKSVSGGKTAVKLPRWAWAAATFLVVALLILGMNRFLSERNVEQALKRAQTPIPVHVNGANPGEYRVTDDRNSVQVDPETGLKAGSYTLTASKAGFEPFSLGFSVNPETDSQKSIDVQWKALQTELRMKVDTRSNSIPVGSLKIDSTELAPNENSAATAKVPNGSHAITWTTPRGDTAEIELVVTDDVAEVKHFTFQGRLVGLLATVSRGAVSYQTINSAGGVTQTVDGVSVTGAPSGTFPIESSKVVSFAVRPGGYPLGDVVPSPDGRPVVFVYLAPQQSKSAGGGKSQTGRGATEPPLSTISPPVKSQEEIDRDRKAQEDARNAQEAEKKRQEFEKKLHPLGAGK
jgi:serine/threonine-protein kinase